MFETLSQARLHGDVGGAPVLVVADAVYDWLRGLGLQWKRLVEGAELEGVLGEQVHGVLLRRHLKQPESHDTHRPVNHLVAPPLTREHMNPLRLEAHYPRDSSWIDLTLMTF